MNSWGWGSASCRCGRSNVERGSRKISISHSPEKGGNLTSNGRHYCAPKVYLAVSNSLAMRRASISGVAILVDLVWGSGYFSLPLPVDWRYYHVCLKADTRSAYITVPAAPLVSLEFRILSVYYPSRSFISFRHGPQHVEAQV